MSKNSGNNSEAKIMRRSTAIAFIAAAVVCIVLFGALAVLTDVSPVIIAPVVIAVYAGLCILIALIFDAKEKQDAPEKLKPIMGRIMFEAVVKMDSPVFICDSSERVIWFNNAMEEMCPKRKLYGERVSDVFGVTLADIRKSISGADSQNDSGAHLSFDGRGFAAQYHHIKTDEEDFTLIVTTETTELDSLSAKMSDDSLVVAYIIIDNLNEMMQYDTELYRPAAAKIDEILRDWAAEYSAILKEYERDKYLLITRECELERMIGQKFDILDKVRSVRAGETSLPLTISMGVASVSGTYEEKEKAAHAALDMALQRGGDQAAVKSDDSMDFFGGVTKTVQKKTSVRARVVSNELMTEIRNASNVLIMGHKRADFDAFGSCVGLARIAMYCGAKVGIVIDTADRNLLGCRNIIAENDDYRGLFISSADALDRLETGTLVIVADANNLEITEEPELAKRTEKLAVIDHHRKMSEFEREPDVEYIEPSASSACELVAEMLEQVLPKDELSVQEANVLLAGITLDTQQFTKNTGTRTFSAAMYLRDRGADPALIRGLFRESFEDYRREAKFRGNVEIYRDIYAITTVGETESGTDDRVIAAKAADNLLMVDGIKASFAIVREGDVVHISARSTGEINVQLIMEELGGGGHFDGAAVQCRGKNTDEVIDALKAAIDNRNK